MDRRLEAFLDGMVETLTSGMAEAFARLERRMDALEQRAEMPSRAWTRVSRRWSGTSPR